jgi:hypothetical protein
MVGEHAAEVVKTCFGRGVCEGFERGDAKAVDGADVDYAGGVVGFCAGFQEWSY